MPRKAKAVKESVAKQVDSTNEPKQVEPIEEPKPISASRDDYIKARAVIQLYRENQKNRPKRPCSEKQLQALAAGREKNSRCKKKPTSESTN